MVNWPEVVAAVFAIWLMGVLFVLLVYFLADEIYERLK